MESLSIEILWTPPVVLTGRWSGADSNRRCREKSFVGKPCANIGENSGGSPLASCGE
jgi:hypothetical protein